MEYKLDYAATGRWMKSDPDLRAACHAAADDIADMAQMMAPVDTGAYRDSIHVEDFEATDRVGAQVVADDPASAPIEFGNERTNGRAVNNLVRAAEAAGFTVKDG